MEGFWQASVIALYYVGATSLLVYGAWLYNRRERLGPAGTPVLVATAITALWGLAVPAVGGPHPGTLLALCCSYLAWLWVLYRLFANDGRHNSVRPIRPVVAALAFVELLQIALLLAATRFPGNPAVVEVAFNLSIAFRLLTSVGALVLLHNLYVGTSIAGRQTLRWPTAALAAMWLYDLNFYTIAYLAGDIPETLGGLRALVLPIMAVFLALGTARDSKDLKLRPSRSVAFQSISLLVIGAYLVAMVLVAQALSYVGGDFARLVQTAFVIAASASALLLLPSKRMRSWLRVVLAKHLFQHRYDYRAEWLRFTQTIARGTEQTAPLHERVIQAVADITDSPSGLLLTEAEGGAMALDTHWQWREIEVPAEALAAETVAFFARERFILDLDDVRQGVDHRGEAAQVPQWLLDDRRAWAMVPLFHFHRLVGIVVLSRPPVARKLDWEDFDLLRVVGQQLASYLSEQAGQEALSEVHRFDEFNRRIAFVMHDIKNLASQLSLLARNAEKHADNPAFREDMLVTLRNSSDKLNALLARLGRYGAGGGDAAEPVEMAPCIAAIVQRLAPQHPVLLAENQACVAQVNQESLEQALLHLIQNAIDASDPDSPVVIGSVVEGLHCRIDIVDSGMGMSPEFVRTRLFKPFQSSKPGGFGIGAYEAREMIRSMNGRLEVESREGLGTRFIVRLPLSMEAGSGMESSSGGNPPPTSEVA